MPGMPAFLRQRQEAMELQGQPWAHNEFEDSLGYMRSCLKNKNKARNLNKETWEVSLEAG